MLKFTNSTPAEITALTTLGVNVKEGPSIGMFGTGMKYAIAGALRLGGNIEISSARRKYSFQARQESIRGREFNIVQMQDYTGNPPRDLGFTTELGKHWQPWMIVRELVANAKDEGGTWGNETTPDDVTTIRLWGAAFDEVWLARSKYFLDETAKPLFESNTMRKVRVLRGSGVYLSGILVLDKPSHFAYDFATGNLGLSEDRTADAWNAGYYAAAALWSKSATEEFISTWAAPEEDTLEHSSSIPDSYPTTELLSRVLSRLWQSHGIKNDKLSFYFIRNRPKQTLPDKSLTTVQQAMLNRACKVLAGVIDPSKYSIRVVENLGLNVFGQADSDTNTILLSSLAFDAGTKILAGTIFEEYIHLAHNLADETRSMQNYLINTIMSLLENLLGEPL